MGSFSHAVHQHDRPREVVNFTTTEIHSKKGWGQSRSYRYGILDLFFSNEDAEAARIRNKLLCSSLSPTVPSSAFRRDLSRHVTDVVSQTGLYRGLSMLVLRPTCIALHISRRRRASTLRQGAGIHVQWEAFNRSLGQWANPPMAMNDMTGRLPRGQRTVSQWHPVDTIVPAEIHSTNTITSAGCCSLLEPADVYLLLVTSG